MVWFKVGAYRNDHIPTPDRDLPKTVTRSFIKEVGKLQSAISRSCLEELLTGIHEVGFGSGSVMALGKHTHDQGREYSWIHRQGEGEVGIDGSAIHRASEGSVLTRVESKYFPVVTCHDKQGAPQGTRDLQAKPAIRVSDNVNSSFKAFFVVSKGQLQTAGEPFFERRLPGIDYFEKRSGIYGGHRFYLSWRAGCPKCHE